MKDGFFDRKNDVPFPSCIVDGCLDTEKFLKMHIGGSGMYLCEPHYRKGIKIQTKSIQESNKVEASQEREIRKVEARHKSEILELETKHFTAC